MRQLVLQFVASFSHRIMVILGGAELALLV